MYSHLLPSKGGDNTEGTSSFGLEEVGLHAGRGERQIQVLKSRNLNAGGGGGGGKQDPCLLVPPPLSRNLFLLWIEIGWIT